MRRVVGPWLALMLVACEPVAGEVAPSLTIAGPVLIPDDGRSIELRAVVTLSRGLATGDVTFTATAGRLEPGTSTLIEGSATTSFTCDVALDARCRGEVEVTASWEALGATHRVFVQHAIEPVDAGAFDAGRRDAGMRQDAGVDAGPVAGDDAGLGGPRYGDAGSVWLVTRLANTPDQQSLVALNLDSNGAPVLLPLGARQFALRGKRFIYELGNRIYEAVPDDWSVYATGDAGGNDVLLPTHACAPINLETMPDGGWAYICSLDGGVGAFGYDVFDGDTGQFLGPGPYFNAMGPAGPFWLPRDVSNLPGPYAFSGNWDRYDGAGGLYFSLWLYPPRGYDLVLRRVDFSSSLSTAVGTWALPRTGSWFGDGGIATAWPDSVTIAPDLSLWILDMEQSEIWKVPLEPGLPQLMFRLDAGMVSQPFARIPLLYPEVDGALLLSTP